MQPKDPDVESLTYDSATYADLVASQLQEERYVACQQLFFCLWPDSLYHFRKEHNKVFFSSEYAG